MTVFKITAPEGFDWVLPIDEDDIELLRFDGQPRRSSWTPVKMERLLKDERGRALRRSDFPSGSGGDMLLLTEKARQALGESLTPVGELLPLDCGDEILWALNVTLLLDVLDQERSELLRSTETGKILRVKKPVFRAGLLDGVELFKLSAMPRGLIYVTEPFVKRVQASRLQGISFDRVWGD